MALWWSPAFRDLSWTTWTCKVSVKTSLNFCSHLHFSLGYMMSGLGLPWGWAVSSCASFCKRREGCKSLPCSLAWAATEPTGKPHCTSSKLALMPLTVGQAGSSFGSFYQDMPIWYLHPQCLTKVRKLRLKCLWSFQVIAPVTCKVKDLGSLVGKIKEDL